MSKLKKLVISVRDNDHCKRLKDPFNPDTFHLETLLPFTEVTKLQRGNANVRPPSEKKPFRDMLTTVEQEPAAFHLKNRGITYICDRFEYSNSTKELKIWIPEIAEDRTHGQDVPTFGIADGGHTFEVIRKTLADIATYKEDTDWSEPFVRVHFLSGQGSQDAPLESIVESLNTSTQVQQFTMEEYRSEFDELKDALQKGGFDIELVAFRENEDKPWHVLEVIQRLACFLKDRWQSIQPTSIYKSKVKGLDLYLNSRGEFRKLYDVIVDVVTLPEYIQHELSKGKHVNAYSFGKLRAVKKLRDPFIRQGTAYETNHRMDLAALLPLAAAFRENLVLRGDRYAWRIPYKDLFLKSVQPLFEVLASRSGKVKVASHMGSDMEFWSACSQVIMRAQLD